MKRSGLPLSFRSRSRSGSSFEYEWFLDARTLTPFTLVLTRRRHSRPDPPDSDPRSPLHPHPSNLEARAFRRVRKTEKLLSLSPFSLYHRISVFVTPSWTAYAITYIQYALQTIRINKYTQGSARFRGSARRTHCRLNDSANRRGGLSNNDPARSIPTARFDT